MDMSLLQKRYFYKNNNNSNKNKDIHNVEKDYRQSFKN